MAEPGVRRGERQGFATPRALPEFWKGFVRLAEIGPVYFESSYYIIPDRAGERAYALLFAALQKAEHVALAKVTMHGREHIIVVRPGRKGLLAHTMYYNDEIRAENEFQPDLSLVSCPSHNVMDSDPSNDHGTEQKKCGL